MSTPTDSHPDSHPDTPSHPHSSGPGRADSPTDSPIAQIRAQVGDAMKAGNKNRAQTLRMLLSEANKLRIDSGAEPSESAVVAVAEKMIKQRREAAQLYHKAGRAELAQKENDEIAILQEFLPEQLPESEVEKLVAEAVANPQNQRNMGKIMAALKSQIAGRADMSKVARQVGIALKS